MTRRSLEPKRSDAEVEVAIVVLGSKLKGGFRRSKRRGPAGLANQTSGKVAAILTDGRHGNRPSLLKRPPPALARWGVQLGQGLTEQLIMYFIEPGTEGEGKGSTGLVGITATRDRGTRLL